MEIARQLTLIQSEYFRAIHPSELVDASWMKDERKEKSSPNLLKLNRFETTVSRSGLHLEGTAKKGAFALHRKPPQKSLVLAF